ncbi:MAG: LysE family translocator [Arenicella sp.]
MTVSSAFALFVSMLVLAATPGPGILLVTSQTTSHGLRAGFLSTLGIIIADIFFILLVAYGLATLAKQIQSLIVIINFFGGIYLVYLGVTSFIKLASANSQRLPNKQPSLKGNINFILSGFLITISNPKAILFYLSFLPAFIDLTRTTHNDVLIIIFIALISITPTMMIYAYISDKATQLSKGKQSRSFISKISSCLIISVGCYMLYRSSFQL